MLPGCPSLESRLSFPEASSGTLNRQEVSLPAPGPLVRNTAQGLSGIGSGFLSLSLALSLCLSLALSLADVSGPSLVVFTGRN